MNTENNKIIAEFMGAVGYHTFNGNFAIIDGKEINMDLYNSDWNWLMEVVEKIESLGYYVNITGTYISIGSISTDNKSLLIEHDGLNKLTVCYEGMIKFIKWYNNQNSAKKTETKERKL